MNWVLSKKKSEKIRRKREKDLERVVREVEAKSVEQIICDLKARRLELRLLRSEIRLRSEARRLEAKRATRYIV